MQSTRGPAARLAHAHALHPHKGISRGISSALHASTYNDRGDETCEYDGNDDTYHAGMESGLLRCPGTPPRVSAATQSLLAAKGGLHVCDHRSTQGVVRHKTHCTLE